MDEKPSYVEFEMRDIEDRTASEAAGYVVTKEVPFAIITPQGSKDRVEREALPWLAYIKSQVQEGRFPQQWSTAYESIFKEWSVAHGEVPLDGTPIKDWQGATKNQINAILNANIRTVEDLANANESAVNSIGMGARALVEKAKAWLKVANDTGKVAARLDSLEKKNDSLVTQNEAQLEKIKALQTTIDSLQKA